MARWWCNWCNGTGFVQVTGIMCRTCGGTGKVKTKPARSCVGPIPGYYGDNACQGAPDFYCQYCRRKRDGRGSVCANGCNWHPCTRVEP